MGCKSPVGDSELWLFAIALCYRQPHTKPVMATLQQPRLLQCLKKLPVPIFFYWFNKIFFAPDKNQATGGFAKRMLQHIGVLRPF